MNLGQRLPRGLVLALACISWGCDRSTPTQPRAESPPAANVVFLNADALAEHHEAIRSIIQTTVAQAGGRLDVGRIQFTVIADPSRAIPGWGIGGFTHGPTEVEIAVNPNSGNLTSVLEGRLPHIVAHEVHHCVRWRSPGPYGTLLDALVFEGMADQFALELVGAGVPPWSMALSPAQITEYLELAKPELDSPAFDQSEWFFGSRDLPNWTGYSLGFHLIGQYIARHPGRTAADLVHEPSESFRPD